MDSLHQTRQGHQYCKNQKQHKCSEQESVQLRVTNQRFSRNCPELSRVHVPTSHSDNHTERINTNKQASTYWYKSWLSVSKAAGHQYCQHQKQQKCSVCTSLEQCIADQTRNCPYSTCIAIATATWEEQTPKHVQALMIQLFSVSLQGICHCRLPYLHGL